MIREQSTKMKLPYFFQQFLGFLAVIIILMTVTVVSLVHFGRNTAVRETENRLFNYAESIVEQNLNGAELNNIQHLLQTQEVAFFIFSETGNLRYPELPSNIEARVVPDRIEELRQGERLSLTTNQEDLLGNPRETAFVYLPYFTENSEEYAGFIAVSAPVSHINQQIDDLKSNLFSAFLLSTIVAVIMSLIFATYQVKRVNRLRKAARRVAEGDYHVRLKHKERDEIDYLSKDFNRMVTTLKLSREEINKQEDRRKTFMQDAAHEMRTPLTTVNGLLEGLEHDVIPEEQKLRSIQLMRKETRRLIRLVNENMDYENIRSHHIILNKQHIPLKEILDEISEQMREIISESSNTLIIENMDNKVIYADYDRLKQILVNLIKNAMQFTDDGTITVEGQQRENATVIAVTDTGIGMDEKEIQFIWDRYYKADHSRVNTKYGESGLGLAIVHELIELHNATVKVESEEGIGSTFILKFPHKKEEDKV